MNVPFELSQPPGMESSTSSEALNREIIETRKAIRQKCNLLKRSREEMDEYFKQKYKPVVNALKENIPCFDQISAEQRPETTLVNSKPLFPERKQFKYSPYTDSSNSCLNVFPSCSTTPGGDPLQSSMRPQSHSTPHIPQVHFSPAEEYVYSPKKPLLERLVEEANTPEGSRMVESFSEKIGQTPASYVMKFIGDEKKRLDSTYGIRYENNRFVLGDSIVTIENDEIDIGDNRYMATKGLLELLFMQCPDMDTVTEEDLQNFKSILRLTKAHRKRYSSGGSIVAKRRHPKWPIISSLFRVPKPKGAKKGSGLSLNQNIERLKCLLASDNCENNREEIGLIEQRLRDAYIIQ